MPSVTARPTRLNLSLYKGDDLTLRFTFTFDLDGFQDWAAQVKTHEAATTWTSFTIDTTDQDDGIIVLSLSGEQIRDLTSGSIWDLEVADANGKVRTLFRGDVDVEEDVTR